MRNSFKTDKNSSSITEALQRNFIQRCKKNSNYSLRAYAGYLEVDQSFLSKLLKGQRRVTDVMAKKFVAKLSLSPSKYLHKASEPHTIGQQYVDLEAEEFELISSWYHFAILELVKIKTFKPDINRIAKQLGLHLHEIKDAVTRLEQLGFLKIKATKWQVISKNNSWLNSEFAASARLRQQIDLTTKALYALEHLPANLRDSLSLTVAVESKRIPEFKEKLAQTLLELSAFFQPNEKNFDSVYQVLFSLYPLTQIANLGEKND